MARRYRRSRTYTRRLKTVKYSNETRSMYFTYAFNMSNVKVPMITEVNTQGMRKCKNFTLNLGANAILHNNTKFDQQVNIFFALVYVPQGTEPSDIGFGYATENQGQVTWTNVSLYEPNQNVILSGMITSGEPAKTFYSRLARNLNSGDGIALIVRSPINAGADYESTLNATLNYAMSY